MPMEVAHAGVFDADTGDYLAGEISDGLAELAGDGDVVLAYPQSVWENGRHVTDEWVPVVEGTTTLPSGTRKVVCDGSSTPKVAADPEKQPVKDEGKVAK